MSVGVYVVEFVPPVFSPQNMLYHVAEMKIRIHQSHHFVNEATAGCSHAFQPHQEYACPRSTSPACSYKQRTTTLGDRYSSWMETVPRDVLKISSECPYFGASLVSHTLFCNNAFNETRCSKPICLDVFHQIISLHRPGHMSVRLSLFYKCLGAYRTKRQRQGIHPSTRPGLSFQTRRKANTAVITNKSLSNKKNVNKPQKHNVPNLSHRFLVSS